VRRPAPPARCSPAPDNPVTWPIRPGNEPIAANLPPERGATRKVYNWTESIYKKVVKDFEKQYAKYDVKVQISTYGTMDDVLGKLVQSDLPRPLDHADIPPSPRSGRSSRTPSTGIAWRVDKVDADIAKLPNPYEALWDERYRGKVGILDDYREAIAMTLLKNGVTDPNTGNPTT
jgi:spermidine/putrescine transport system substrate-binding protein